MKARHFATVCLLLSGCALTEKAPPVEIRYFSPQQYRSTTREPAPSEGARQLELRFGRIGSSAHLRSRISYRTTGYELGSYETLRWADDPETYLRRELHRALFETRPLVERVSGHVPSVEIELVAFEEVRKDGAKFGRVALHYSLRDESRVLADGNVDVERRASAGGGIENVVGAIAAALTAAADEVAERVLQALPPKPSP
jgi:cholesterol transport system auxiliary component